MKNNWSLFKSSIFSICFFVFINAQSSHFQFTSTDNFEPIFVNEINSEEFTPEIGVDEVAVFDGFLCVGATLIMEDVTQISAWADDGFTSQIDGFIQGSLMSFRYYDSSENKVWIVSEVEFIEGGGWDTSGRFVLNAICGVNLNLFTEAPNFITSTPIEWIDILATPEYSYTIVAEHPNSETLSFIKTTAPAWLTLTDNGDNSALLSGIPWSVGEYSVVITVTDNSSDISFENQYFTITANEGSAENNTQLSVINYQLVNAYPNPFNPKTVISYQLQASSLVLVDIYNINGQLVEELVSSSMMQNAGYHSVTWNADNQPSGIYFAKLQAGDFTQTLKLLLLK